MSCSYNLAHLSLIIYKQDLFWKIYIKRYTINTLLNYTTVQTCDKTIGVHIVYRLTWIVIKFNINLKLLHDILLRLLSNVHQFNPYMFFLTHSCSRWIMQLTTPEQKQWNVFWCAQRDLPNFQNFNLTHESIFQKWIQDEIVFYNKIVNKMKNIYCMYIILFTSQFIHL